MRSLGLLVLAVVLLAKGINAGKIIAVPLCGAPSHVFIMWKICRELTARGESVVVNPLNSIVPHSLEYYNYISELAMWCGDI